MWQEGIAQYVEQPTEQLENKMELMRQIVAEKRYLSWRDLNQPGVTYSDPRIGYPQSLTIVAFLVSRNGIEKFKAFVEAMKTASGYRGALEAVYGVSADTLEREWLQQLPAYANGGYRSPGGSPTGRGPLDLQQTEQLLERGDYAGAARALRPLVESAGPDTDAATLQQAQSLLARAEAGQKAMEQASDAHTALLNGDYQSAYENGVAALQAWEAVGQAKQAATSASYVALAERGMHAQADLDEAGALLRRLQLRGAEERLVSAYRTFGELGDEPRASQAREAMALIDRGEQILAGTCLLCGALLVAWSARRRYDDRSLALPYT